MRRNSPPRFPRRSTPRRGNRPRSLSPLSRSQPAPPGEERKRNPWDGPNPPKRPRSGSRSRDRMLHGRENERDRLRRMDREPPRLDRQPSRMDREPPVISLIAEEPPRGRFDRGREPPRDMLRKEEERARERSRERNRERDRALHASRMEEKDAKQKHHNKRHPIQHNREQNDGFEENYLDQPRNNFGNNMRLHSNHGEPILDPSVITFNTFQSENLHDNPRNIRHEDPRDMRHENQRDMRHENPRDMHHENPRDIHLENPRGMLRENSRDRRPDNSRDRRQDNPRDRHQDNPRDTRPESSRDVRHDSTRDTRHPSIRPSNSFGKNEKQEKENPEERIKRLEKLVEKLVEDRVEDKPSKERSHAGGRPQSKEVPELIPSNSKYTTSMWINKIHEECLHRNFDEKSSIRYMQDKMTGIMKAWFKSVSNYDFTWPELKLLITKTFPDNVDFAQTLKLLVARDKMADETVTQYYFSKVYLCEACKITGENAVSCLIDGLGNPFLKQEVKSLHFLTPEVLYSEYLSKFPEHDLPVRMDHREVRLDNREEPVFHNEDFIPLEVYDRMDRGMDRSRDYRLSATPLPVQGAPLFDNRPMEKPIPMERPKCFTCKKFGHLTLDCRHAPICYKCKKKGHIAAKCHFNKVLLISSVGNITQGASMVKCQVKGQEVVGFIDTGSMTVTMKRGLSDSLKLKFKNTHEVLQGYGGSVVLPIGEVVLSLTIDSIERSVKVLIVDDNVQDHPLIIGQEFLFKNIAVLIQNGDIHVFDAEAYGVESYK